MQVGQEDQLASMGHRISILGSVFASPAASSGSKPADKFPRSNPHRRLPVYIGPHSIYPPQARSSLAPDAYGRRAGYVFARWHHQCPGNIIAEQGSGMDVSGTNGELDLNPAPLALCHHGDYL